MKSFLQDSKFGSFAYKFRYLTSKVHIVKQTGTSSRKILPHSKTNKQCKVIYIDYKKSKIQR